MNQSLVHGINKKAYVLDHGVNKYLFFKTTIHSKKVVIITKQLWGILKSFKIFNFEIENLSRDEVFFTTYFHSPFHSCFLSSKNEAL